MKLSVNALHIVRLVALTAVADSSVIPKSSQSLFLPCDTSQFIDVREKIERVTALGWATYGGCSLAEHDRKGAHPPSGGEIDGMYVSRRHITYDVICAQ